MNELLPIIRRKRRPLLPVESLPLPVAENIQPSSSNYDAPSHPTPNAQLPMKESPSLVTSAATNENEIVSQAPSKRKGH